MNRTTKRKIMVGNVQIGGNNKVVIQSMTTSKTKNIKHTISQIKELENVGCEIVRVAVVDMEDALAISEIKKQIKIPLVADIHFDYKLALESIKQGIDKIRINPGNIGDESRVKAVVDACKKNNIPIRIGVNAGSLEKHILEKYKHPSAQGMIESAKYHVDLLEKFDFKNIIISLKSSNMQDCIEAYKIASKTFDYPLHIGITESGSSFSGTIRSSIGLGILLNEGIGSTIRVSLSTDPTYEIKVCKELLSNFDLYDKPKLISCPTCGRLQYDMFDVVNKIETFLETIDSKIVVAIMGCGVNGPGEAREADIGIAGGKDSGLLFKNGEIIRKIPKDNMVEILKEEILNYISENK